MTHFTYIIAVFPRHRWRHVLLSVTWLLSVRYTCQYQQMICFKCPQYSIAICITTSWCAPASRPIDRDATNLEVESEHSRISLPLKTKIYTNLCFKSDGTIRDSRIRGGVFFFAFFSWVTTQGNSRGSQLLQHKFIVGEKKGVRHADLRSPKCAPPDRLRRANPRKDRKKWVPRAWCRAVACNRSFRWRRGCI